MSLRTRVAHLQRGADAAGHCWRCGGEHVLDLAVLQELFKRAKAGGRVLLCDCRCCWHFTSLVAEVQREAKRRG